MKIIHCADLHLDSKLQTHLNNEEAKERRLELLHNFSRLVQYAKSNEVEAILISGDLFDTRKISAITRNTVLGEIRNHPEIVFYYLRGNHDNDEVLGHIEDNSIPNIYTFDYSWKSSLIKDTNIMITGIEINEENSEQMYSSLVLSAENFNIVMLHGMISEHRDIRNFENISLSLLKNKNIDYLALGHIHQYQEGKLFPKGEWAYSGCLEGRGMDEVGEHGFIVLDIDSGKRSFKKTFIKFAKRKIFEIEVDIRGCIQTMDIQKRVELACLDNNVTENDYVHIILTGEVDAEVEKNPHQIQNILSQKYYISKVDDNTSFYVDYRLYQNDATLKGEFIRLVQNKNNVQEEEKAEIIRAGILALREEEF